MAGKEESVGRELVNIVDRLADCQIRILQAPSRSGCSVKIIECITEELGAIAEKLFDQWVKEGSSPDGSKPEKAEGERGHEGGVSEAAGLEKRMNLRYAPLCTKGVGCVFGLRGRCAWFHPEGGKNEDIILDSTPYCSFGFGCTKKPFCRYQHGENNCHMAARGYFNV